MKGSRWIGVVLIVIGALTVAWRSSRSSTTHLTADGAAPRAQSSPHSGVTGRSTAIAEVTEHGFTVEDELDPLPLDEWIKRGRPPPTGDVVAVFTGIADGPVHVAVEALVAPPPAVEVEGWEEVAEITVNPSGRLRA